MQPFRDFAPRVAELVQIQPYPALNAAFDPIFYKGQRSYWKGVYSTGLADPAVQVHVERGSTIPCLAGSTHLYPINGACHRVDPDATAFPYRHASFATVLTRARATRPRSCSLTARRPASSSRSASRRPSSQAATASGARSRRSNTWARAVSSGISRLASPLARAVARPRSTDSRARVGSSAQLAAQARLNQQVSARSGRPPWWASRPARISGATDRADRRHSNRMYSGCGFSRSTSLAVISRLPVFTSSE